MRAEGVVQLAGKDSPPPALHLDPGLKRILDGLPTNYYPASSKGGRPRFDYTRNSLFQRTGRALACRAP